MKHGKGSFIWHNGTFYDGDWMFNKRSGNTGRLEVVEGMVYEGGWKNDKPEVGIFVLHCCIFFNLR